MAAAEAVAVVLSSSLKPDPAPAPVPESAGTAAATATTSSAMAAAAALAAAARTGSEATVSKPALATKLLSLSGVFAVHKPKGPTSAELLNQLKEKLLAGTAAGWGPGGGHAVAVRAEAAQSTLGVLPFKAQVIKGRERENEHCISSGQKSGASPARTCPDVNSCSLVGSCRSQGKKNKKK